MQHLIMRVHTVGLSLLSPEYVLSKYLKWIAAKSGIKELHTGVSTGK